MSQRKIILTLSAFILISIFYYQVSAEEVTIDSDLLQRVMLFTWD